MTKRTTGRYERTTVGGEEVAAFIPHPLPPAEPSIFIDEGLHSVARQALIRLELAGAMIPSLDWFIYAFVRKEAVLSSQIEGTQATLVDLLTFEAQEGEESNAAPNADVEEVCNYLEALAYSREQIASPKGLPLSMRLPSEKHRRSCAVFEAPTNPQAKCDEARTGSAALGRATPPMSRSRRTPSEMSSALSKSTFTPRTRCHRSCARVCFTCSSRRSTRISTATAA